jgi:hypothetical protein
MDAMRLPVLALLALLASASAGCRTSVVPTCRQLCTCSPCTDGDLDACVDKAAAIQGQAEAQGCTELFEVFVDCFERHQACDMNLPTPATACSRAARNLTACTDAGTPFTTTCDDAFARIQACVPTAMPGVAQPCTGLVACQAGCTLGASCEVLAGTVVDDTFNSCINACFGVSQPPPPGD